MRFSGWADLLPIGNLHDGVRTLQRLSARASGLSRTNPIDWHESNHRQRHAVRASQKDGKLVAVAIYRRVRAQRDSRRARFFWTVIGWRDSAYPGAGLLHGSASVCGIAGH